MNQIRTRLRDRFRRAVEGGGTDPRITTKADTTAALDTPTLDLAVVPPGAALPGAITTLEDFAP